MIKTEAPEGRNQLFKKAEDRMELIAAFPILAMILGGIGATLGLYLLSEAHFNQVMTKGTGLFLTIIMTYVCFCGAAYAMADTMIKTPGYLESAEQPIANPMGQVVPDQRIEYGEEPGI